MPNLIWRDTQGRLVNITETPFETGEILGDIFVLSRQVQTSTREERPDIVGVDRENNVVLAELKNAAPNESIIPQLLRYAIWAETNPDSIKAMWLEQKQKPSDIEINWDSLSVRLIILAPEIPARVLRLVNKINYPVELIEVQRYTFEGNDFVIVNSIEPEPPPTVRITKAPGIYDREWYLEFADQHVVDRFFEIVGAIEGHIESKGWRLKTKLNKWYVSFKHGFRNVCGIGFDRSGRFTIWFMMPKDTYDQIDLPLAKMLQYTGWNSALYEIAQEKVDLKQFDPLFEAAYRHVTGRAS